MNKAMFSLCMLYYYKTHEMKYIMLKKKFKANTSKLPS